MRFPELMWLGRNQLTEGLKMKQESDLSFKSPINGKSPKEIVGHFKSYGFEDGIGHKLEHCTDFIELVELAAKNK